MAPLSRASTPCSRVTSSARTRSVDGVALGAFAVMANIADARERARSVPRRSTASDPTVPFWRGLPLGKARSLSRRADKLGRSVAAAVHDPTTQQFAAGACSSVEQLVSHLTVLERQLHQREKRQFVRRRRFVESGDSGGNGQRRLSRHRWARCVVAGRGHCLRWLAC
ncbi:MAG: hypothetical protein QOD93_7304 [Acetobacteraceae bacterium]|nr:hypothetical protein [Acetobacteraceae bacterium]